MGAKGQILYDIIITKILHRNGQNSLRPLKNLPSQTNITRDTTMVNIDYVHAQLHINLIEQGAEYYIDPTLCLEVKTYPTQSKTLLCTIL